jgi:hypothetical protein
MDGLSSDPASVSRRAGRRRRPSRVFRPALGFERVEERTLLSLALVSANAAGTASGNSDSTLGGNPLQAIPGIPTQPLAGNPSQAVSADGRLMVFQSDATDLVPGLYDSNKTADVFVRNLQTGQTELVSATPGGKVGNGSSFSPIISPDGRYVAFLSTATNLSSATPSVPGGGSGPVNWQGFLYVRDLQTQTRLSASRPKAACHKATSIQVMEPWPPSYSVPTARSSPSSAQRPT